MGNQTERVRQRFDTVLLAHMKRLLGESHGPGGLPLNLLNVSCMVLLSEQHVNEEKQFCTEEDRYTQASLFQELAETGFDAEADFAKMLEQMQELSYVRIDASGLISGGRPVLKAARLIDAVLPQMPGLNLVAYIAQTIDEAVSGRKAVDDAVDQFDQTLMLQGVSATKSESDVKNEEMTDDSSGEMPTAGDTLPRADKDPGGAEGKNLLSAADYDRLKEVVNQHASTSEPAAGPRIISSDGGGKKVDVKVVSFGAPLPVEKEPGLDNGTGDKDIIDSQPDGTGIDSPAPELQSLEPDAGDQLPDFENREAVREDAGSETTGQSKPPAGEDGPNQVDIDEEQVSSEDGIPERVGADYRGGTGPSTAEEVQPEGIEKPVRDGTGDNASAAEAVFDEKSEEADPPATLHEDAIEAQISSFETDLSMQCPVCNSGKIIGEKTAKGKAYYKCSSKTCSFISWGKPYHQVCPRCNNSFLVEHVKNGQSILKCPRATCNYWQDEAGGNADATPSKKEASGKTSPRKPRRRVVKRRVVRRKKA